MTEGGKPGNIDHGSAWDSVEICGYTVMWNVGNSNIHEWLHGISFEDTVVAFESLNHNPEGPKDRYPARDAFTAEISLSADRVERLHARDANPEIDDKSGKESFRQQLVSGRIPESVAVNLYYERHGNVIHLVGSRLADKGEVNRLEERQQLREQSLEKDQRYLDWMTEREQAIRRIELEQDRDDDRDDPEREK